MRYVLLTFVGEQGIEEWERMSRDARRAYVERHRAWFRTWGEHVRGGEELGSPSAARTVLRQRGRVTVTDGPFLETKELLGGFIVVDVTTPDEAVQMARDWPSLGTDGNRVEVWPAGDSSAETEAAPAG